MNTNTNTPACTCPSGDGSLVWPCPAHTPAAPQDERACGNEDCGWTGQTDRMCGTIGPLCPDCGETTEAVGRAALPAQAVASATPPLEMQGIAEALKDGGGFWATCTGCHESNEGHPTGPFSATLKCHLGTGCSECGGIGAVWDTTDYQAMADYMAGDMALAAPVQDVAPTVMHECCMDGMPCQGCERRGVVAKDVAPSDARAAAPVEPNALAASIAELDALMAGEVIDPLIPSEVESIMLVLHEVKRLRAAQPAAQPADAQDAARLDYLIGAGAWIEWVDRDDTIRQCQLLTQNEDEEYVVLSGPDRFFNTPRAAIEAAMARTQEGAAS